MSKNTKTTNNQVEDQPILKKKLPYVKPELHLLNLEGTEGKFNTSAKENTITITLASTSKFGPS